jgi:glycosyl hydrolase family 26
VFPALTPTVRRVRSCVILVAVALTTALTTAAAPALAANPVSTLGVYAGGGSPAAVASFEARLGRPVRQVLDYQPKDSWSTLDNIGWSLDQWTSSRYAQRVAYSIPMLPDSGGSLAEGATGAFNEHFRTLALALVAGGSGSATLRLGWEFNGTWFKWSINTPNGAADYAAYWRQIVTTMRSVPGAHFKFDWCATNVSSYVGGKQLDAASAYPGDAYVDYVGMDIYDQSWSSRRADPAARWNDYVNQKDGLKWHRDFAAAHGKPMTFPEWGIAHRPDGNGGGDAPYFIERMYEWIRTNPVAYHNYFEFADPSIDSKLFAGSSPRAAKRFIELFGAGSDGGPLDGHGAPAAPSGQRQAPKLRVTRARIVRRSQRVELLAAISRLATGRVRVALVAGGQRTSFATAIRHGRLRISHRISRRQARQPTAVVTITYAGNARTAGQVVRLRMHRQH